MPTRVVVRNEVVHPSHVKLDSSGWRLALQWTRYMHENGSIEDGYRFIWRRPDGSLQAARGQARIPSLTDAMLLMRLATENGWGNMKADDAISDDVFDQLLDSHRQKAA